MVLPVSFIYFYFMHNYCYRIYPISSLGLIIAVVFVGYALLKYKIIDVTDFFRKIIIYLCNSIIFIILIIWLLLISKTTIDISPLIIFSLIVLFIFNPINLSIQNFFNKLVSGKRHDYQKIIEKVSKELVAVLDYDKLTNLLSDTIISQIKVSSFKILYFNYKTEMYIPIINDGQDKTNSISYKHGDEIIELIQLANREIFLDELEEISSEEVKDNFLKFFTDNNAFLIIPMIHNEKMRGIFCLGEKISGEIYNYRDIQLLKILSYQAAIALDNARLYELAITDELTGLYIIRFFNQKIIQEISASIRLKKSTSLLFLDLDFFKNVNDTYGHQMGDIILKGIADIILQEVRAIDLVTRYGGEEFAIILPDTNNETGKLVAERIRKSIEKHNFPKEIKCTISIGISTIDGAAASNIAEQLHSLDTVKRENLISKIKTLLVEEADKALYSAKSKGRNLYINSGNLKI